ncbi:MAG: leucyl/phenylalanyl-tRNA--protein transferase [Chitinophagaceae bacterium]
MSITILDNKLWFPPVDATDEEGLLAIGGGLEIERLILAYRKGIFPWYEGPIPLWWCPDPRFVLFPGNLKLSKSMQKILAKNEFTFTINESFSQVIHACKNVARKGVDGTWINEDLIRSFIELHDKGIAHSAEAWLDGKLVGGLYGIRMGNVFFGESMFSKISNSSKFAFIKYMHVLAAQNVCIIDCQVFSEHLKSLGANFISRDEFIKILEKNIP